MSIKDGFKAAQSWEKGAKKILETMVANIPKGIK